MVCFISCSLGYNESSKYGKNQLCYVNMSSIHPSVELNATALNIQSSSELKNNSVLNILGRKKEINIFYFAVENYK